MLCSDYGNSETNDRDDGCGTMEAIYFGNAHCKCRSLTNLPSFRQELILDTSIGRASAAACARIGCARADVLLHAATGHHNTGALTPGAKSQGPWAGADLEQGMCECCRPATCMVVGLAYFRGSPVSTAKLTAVFLWHDVDLQTTGVGRRRKSTTTHSPSPTIL